MKIVSIVLSIIALGLIVFNVTNIDFNNPLKEESTIALIEILAAIIALLILAIFTVSKRIEKKVG